LQSAWELDFLEGTNSSCPSDLRLLKLYPLEPESQTAQELCHCAAQGSLGKLTLERGLMAQVLKVLEG